MYFYELEITTSRFCLDLCTKRYPQSAVSGLVHFLQDKWNYLQCMSKDSHKEFLPVEKIIQDTFIPKVFGDNLPHPSRSITSLPIKGGGTGILDPSNPLASPYEISHDATSHLSDAVPGHNTFTMGTYLAILTKGRSHATQVKV